MIDVDRHSVQRDGTQLKLTPKEFDLLLRFVRHAGRVPAHHDILNAVWGPSHVEDVQYLRVLVGSCATKPKASLKSRE